ncbi:hypothetical protein C8R46DRAFT_1038514 [Mycena filopes]|nr:hypothetical protein C8R46DRAFT_1038514 [Mycena filopes]
MPTSNFCGVLEAIYQWHSPLPNMSSKEIPPASTSTTLRRRGYPERTSSSPPPSGGARKCVGRDALSNNIPTDERTGTPAPPSRSSLRTDPQQTTTRPSSPTPECKGGGIREAAAAEGMAEDVATTRSEPGLGTLPWMGNCVHAGNGTRSTETDPSTPDTNRHGSFATDTTPAGPPRLTRNRTSSALRPKTGSSRSHLGRRLKVEVEDGRGVVSSGCGYRCMAEGVVSKGVG